MYQVNIRIVFSAFLAILCGTVISAQQNPPKLVVGIVVDQMRYEYLNRFAADFGDDGFKRIQRDGFTYANAHFHYTPTTTAPGHASVYTGCSPHRHGIMGNYWYNKALDASVYCAADDSVQVVGGEGRGMSPHRMHTTTITDELQLATGGRSKVIGISIKDRGAVLPAGHLADGAYWLARDGRFVTSTYYRDSLPSWVQAFNDLRLPQQYIAAGWQAEEGVDFIESLPDDNDYEARLGGKERPVFPYDMTTFVKKGGLASIRTSPHGNTIVRRLGQEAMKAEGMGKDEVTDFLCLSFSSTDYIGHAMGPRSREIQDTYIKLDRELAELLDYLDVEVGAGEYMIFLTADHGAAEVPAHLQDLGYDARTVHEDFFKDILKDWSMDRYGQNVIKHEAYGHVHLNDVLIAELGLDREAILEAAKARISQESIVDRVYTRDEILRGHPQDEILGMTFRGYHPQQNGDLITILRPGSMIYKATGTSHGSPYDYDTHVPILMYGKGVPQGKSYRLVHPTAIAGTLSHLLGTTMPQTAEKTLLIEVLK